MKQKTKEYAMWETAGKHELCVAFTVDVEKETYAHPNDPAPIYHDVYSNPRIKFVELLINGYAIDITQSYKQAKNQESIEQMLLDFVQEEEEF